MAKYKFTTELSADGIKNLRKELSQYKNTLQHKANLLAKKLSENGVDIARMQVAKLDAVFTGELISSIEPREGFSNNNVAVFYVVADSEHAIYVEVGTGKVGADYPYPGKLPVIYAQGKTIHHTKNGKYGWFYQNEQGEWFFTEGMESRPFMHETWKELYEPVEKVAKEVFK